MGLTVTQIVVAFRRRRRYDTVCAWTERVGLPLALLYKLRRHDGDLLIIGAWPARSRKRVFFRPLGVHSHMRAMVSGSTVQLDALNALGVPRGKLRVAPWPVDERFWSPGSDAVENSLCAAGWEARDYGTLVRAVEGLSVETHIALGVAATWLPSDESVGTGL
ncbi:MAG TPA: hypothetical protein VG795_00385, partial [Acidimicrobiia bacterium]|nr:hypothetical protein [Acidimicrobiia bacterium]